MLYIIIIAASCLLQYVIFINSEPLSSTLYLNEITSPIIFNTKKDKFFNIAALLPYTFTGTKYVVYEGVFQTLSLICAVDSFNDNKTFLPNVTLTAQVRDVVANSEKATSATVSVIADKNIIVVLGILNSLQSIISSQFLKNYDIGYIDFTTPNELIESSNYVKLDPMAIDLSTAVTKLLLSMNWTLVSVLYGDYLFGSAIKESFTIQAENSGIIIECDRILPLAFTLDDNIASQAIIADFVSCLFDLSAQVNVIVLFASGSIFLSILDFLYQYESLRSLTFVFVSSTSFNPLFHLYTYTALKIPESYLFGTISIVPNIANSTPIDNCFAKYTPSNTIHPAFLGFWELVFRCAVVLPNNTALTINQIPVCPDELEKRIFPPQCVCSGNEALNKVPYSPLNGLIFDSVEAIAFALNTILTQCNSDIVELPFDCEAITGVDLLDTIRNLSFVGTAGLTTFSKYSPINPKLKYLQFVGKPFDNTIGYYQNGSIYIDYSALQFRDGNSIPISAVIPETISFSYIGAIIVVSLTSLFIVICISFMVLIWYYRHEPPIKKASPLFCILILIGILLGFSSIIVNSAYLTTITCNVSLWLIVLALGLIMGNILAKTYRIFRIFSNVRINAAVIKDKDLLIFSFSVLLILSVFLICISVNSDSPVVVTSVDDPLITYYICVIDNDLAKVSLYVLLAIIGSLFLLLAVIAYLTRNVDSAFNESAYIATTIYAYLAILIIIFPLYLATTDHKNAAYLRYFEFSISIFVAMVVTLSVLFIPKFYFIYKSKKGFTFILRTQTSTIETEDSDSMSFSSRITEIDSDTDKSSFNIESNTELLFLSNFLWSENDKY